MIAFAAFLIFSVILYLPLRLIFGDSAWLVPGHYPLPIQTSRILLYAGYFLAGVAVGAVSLRTGMLAVNGALAKRWTAWLGFAFACYGQSCFWSMRTTIGWRISIHHRFGGTWPMVSPSRCSAPR